MLVTKDVKREEVRKTEVPRPTGGYMTVVLSRRELIVVECGCGSLVECSVIRRLLLRRRAMHVLRPNISEDGAPDAVSPSSLLPLSWAMRSSRLVLLFFAAAAFSLSSATTAQRLGILPLPPQRSDHLIECLLHVDAIFCRSFNEIATHFLGQGTAFLRRYLAFRYPIALVPHKHDRR